VKTPKLRRVSMRILEADQDRRCRSVLQASCHGAGSSMSCRNCVAALARCGVLDAPCHRRAGHRGREHRHGCGVADRADAQQGAADRIYRSHVDSVHRAHVHLSAILSGLGVGLLPRHMVGADVQQGTLVPLLRQFQPVPEGGIYLVYLPNRTQPHACGCLLTFSPRASDPCRRGRRVGSDRRRKQPVRCQEADRCHRQELGR